MFWKDLLFSPILMAINASNKPTTSVNICAASANNARLLVTIPPMTSAMR
jgi:hypothetical protein